MNDLISRQELLESIEKVSVKGNVIDDDWVYRFVQEFPSIDAVQVVRCKDCKYGEVDDPDFPDQYYCHSTGFTWNEGDFFCADGERKEE